MTAPTYGEILHAARAVVLQTMPGDPPPEHAMDILRAVVARWDEHKTDHFRDATKMTQQ